MGGTKTELKPRIAGGGGLQAHTRQGAKRSGKEEGEKAGDGG